MVNLITDHMDVWTSAQIQKTNGVGRGNHSANHSLNGIKKLRELILGLAVRGRLVPQDPNDEPASVLLEKIAKEKARLIKEGQIKKGKKLPEIEVGEFPFDIPKGWQYVRLNDLGEWGAGATPLRGKHTYYGGSIPWFKSGELIGDYISHSEEFITDLALKETSLRYNKTGDVLIAMYGATIGKTSILEVPATTNQAVCACTPFSGIYNVFLLTVLKAYKNRFITMGAGGAQPNISREKIIATVISLPPLAEQHHIVTKVDELMTICDQLEQQQTENNAAHSTLVETLLATLTSAANQDEFVETWQRIANHFDILFITEQSIDQLKQTILQLAVMGKLVRQDTNDEPANVLLEKIAREKARLIKEGKLKKQEPLPEITDNEKTFELPDGWVWTRLGEVTNYGISDKAEPDSVDDDTWVLELEDVEKETSILLQKVRFTDRRFRSSKNRFFKGDVIYGKLRPYLDKVIVADEDGVCTTEMIPISGYNNITPQYLRLVMKSPYFISYANDSTHGMNLPRMGTDKARLALFPMVSEAEQNRIVAKVDELMVLCDSLKARINDAQTIQVQLADAIVEQAVA